MFVIRFTHLAEKVGGFEEMNDEKHCTNFNYAMLVYFVPNAEFNQHIENLKVALMCPNVLVTIRYLIMQCIPPKILQVRYN